MREGIQAVSIGTQIQAINGTDFVEAISISFVFSKKDHSRFKQVSFNFELGELSEQSKLNKWTNENRIIRVCETGTQCFVHIHEEHKDRFNDPKSFHELQVRPGRSLKEIDFEIETLNDEEYQEIKDAAKEIFEKEQATFSLSQKKEVSQGRAAPESQIKAVLGLKQISDIFLVKSWKEIILTPFKIVQAILNTMTESIREEDKRSKEIAEHNQIIANEIRKQALKHDVLSSEIKTAEIQESVV